MFQEYALFPHIDVAANVAFGLRMQGLSRDYVQNSVAEMLAMVGLTGYDRRRVYDLSGGERQRVALARSLAPGPRLLMLDEPLGSLDRTLREELMNELRSILKRVGVTAIYVTHDQEDAFAVADRVAIMRQGCIVQEGSPPSVYLQPASAWVARFLGLTNLIPGRVVAHGPLRVDTVLGTLTLEHLSDRPEVGQEVTVLIRPEAARIALPSAAGLASQEERGPQADPTETAVADEPLIIATVSGCSFRGSHYRLTVRPALGPELAFEMTSGASGLPAAGEAVSLSVRTESIGLLQEAQREMPQAEAGAACH
jgi:ABC-type Fe3+/spermidine/putrescine transport system ATPase subunit